MKPKDLITFLDKNDFNNIDPSNNFGGYVDEGYYVVYTELFVKFLKEKKYKICVSTLKDLLGKVLRFEKKTDFLKKLFKKKFPSFNLNKHYSFWKKKILVFQKCYLLKKLLHLSILMIMKLTILTIRGILIQIYLHIVSDFIH